MAPSTPRFVFGSSGPAPQFAAAPRFVFQMRRDGADEEIEESEGNAFLGNSYGLNSDFDVNNMFWDGEDVDNHGLLLTSSPSRHRSKRRRVSISSEGVVDETTSKGEFDRISPSPSPPRDLSMHIMATPRLAENTNDLASPTLRRMTPTPNPPAISGSTPQISASQKPRFLFNSNSQSQPTAGPTATQLQRPLFKIPRTPSRPSALSDMSLLTSPIAFPYAKRRSKAGTHNFLSGGIASEVRGWLLELGARKQVFQDLRPSSSSKSTQSLIDRGKIDYHLVGEVNQVGVSNALFTRKSQTSKPGYPSLFTAVILSPESLHGLSLPPPPQQLLLFGVPTLGSGPIKKGVFIGIQPGLVWEMNMEPHLSQNLTNPSPTPTQGDSGTEQGAMSRKWLVSVEWDILLTRPGGKDI
ncbi:hypothetical protein LOZ66_006520 [Ophidiomyces ophidiicola]|nr:hypothetical protein LOZ66_006520 [Ophidiomyces ophidiicola]